MRQAQLDRLFQSAQQGNASSREPLFSSNCGELHRQRELRRDAFPTMSPATRQQAAAFDRARLLANASRAMRGLLIEYLAICPVYLGNTFADTTTGRHK